MYSFKCDLKSTVVETTKGKVQGFECNGVYIYKGIPYAKAKRFRQPQPADAWEGIFNATNYGKVCPLMDQPKPWRELCVPHRYWVMDENCQNLNIWTPACDDKKRPVLVWLHGGGYEAGSAIEQVAYDGENMSRDGQVVVVSINHRLNILGYFDLSSYGDDYKNSANAGNADIVEALKWIRDNIERFGGDPENVTLFGQSGGGSKIADMLQTPAADGLFSRGIIMSGVLPRASFKGDGKALAEAMLKELNADGIQALEELPYEVLVTAYKKVRTEFVKEGKYIGCRPLKNEYYMGDPLEYGFREETSGIPLIVGTAYGEMAPFIQPNVDRENLTEEQEIDLLKDFLGSDAVDELLPLFASAYPCRLPADLLSLDFKFRGQSMLYIAERGKQNSNTYAYVFNQDFTLNGGTLPWHCSDIPYVFKNTSLVPVTWEAGVTEQLEKQIFEAVISFARTGNPNNDYIPEWKSSTGTNEFTMIFDKDTRLVCDHDKELIPLFEKYMRPIYDDLVQKGRDKLQH